MKKENKQPKHDIQRLVGNTLRWGVTLACVIAAIGGVIYLMEHGGEPMKDYSHFAYGAAAEEHESYTTLSGIVDGVINFTATGWIQLGVIAPVSYTHLTLPTNLLMGRWRWAAVH